MTQPLSPCLAPLAHHKTYKHCGILWALTLIPLSGHAADFTTNFESTNFNTVQDFTVTNNSLSATFSGGTSFTIGNGALYHSGTKSWMLDPAGTTSRGTSTGVGTITFSTQATSLDFYIRTSNSSSTGQVQIIDNTDAVIEDITSTIVNGSWLHIEKTLNAGDPLMTSITVSAFGNNMLAIDDLSFSTDAITVIEEGSNEDDGNGDDGNTGGSIGDPITGPEDDSDDTQNNDDTEDATENNDESENDNEESALDSANADATNSSSGSGPLYLILLLAGLLFKRKS